MSDKIWTTKDGDDIPVSKMTDSHLLNTLRYLVRTHSPQAMSAYYLSVAASADAYSTDAPDGAAYAAEDEAMSYYGLAEQARECDADAIVPDIFSDLLAEAKFRKLDVADIDHKRVVLESELEEDAEYEFN